MSGKRPDQFRLDRDEAGTTDYKFLPDRPAEGDGEAELYGRVMKGNARKQQPVLPNVPSPDAAEPGSTSPGRRGRKRARGKKAKE